MMQKQTTLALLFLTAIAANAQSKATYRVQRKVPSIGHPECTKGAICFSGEVTEGKEFRKTLNADLDFVLALPGGIDIVPKQPDPACNLSQWIANPPLRAHHDTEIDAAYDWTAEQEVTTSPREFQIVQNCREYQSLYDPVYGQPTNLDAEKYFDVLKTLKSKGRLWITASRVTHSHDSVNKGNGAIEWLKFSVEIVLTTQPTAASPPQPEPPHTH
jgi:hypothetical protein